MSHRISAKRVFEFLVKILPLTLFFSYFPVIQIATNESMNFELSLPLLWLVIFDVVAAGMVVKLTSKQKLKLRGAWTQQKVLGIPLRVAAILTLALPVWLTLSVAWSENQVRGILTAGVLWLIYAAIVLMIILARYFGVSQKYRRSFWRWFYGAGLIACGWCILQCVLDLVGVEPEATLMCMGCRTVMFGFPHPNGWAIEPQFMGNLLLAPTFVALWDSLNAGKKESLSGARKRWVPQVLFAIFATTLFLTFSRGAIYAFGVGIVVMTILYIVKRRKDKKELLRVATAWMLMVLSFLVALNCQAVMALVGPTHEDYGETLAKAIHHLSLGVVDVRVKPSEKELKAGEAKAADEEVLFSGETVVFTEPVFDGYVEESTNVRMELTKAALNVWRSSPETIWFGVGLGGAGQALYENHLTATPKEIVQNEYASLVLESGIVGIVLAVIVVIIVVAWLAKYPNYEVILALMVAYGITLMFFSGLPNALQVYLAPALLVIFLKKEK